MAELKPESPKSGGPDTDPRKELHYEVVEINESNFDSWKDSIKKLSDESIRYEGSHFLEKVIERWESGEHRFSGEGDTLYGLVVEGELVATGGLNREKDPAFKGDPNVGRLRHLYVAQKYRRKHHPDATKQLSDVLMDLREKKARENGWHTLTLHSSESRGALQVLERHGFQRYEGPTTTDISHIKKLEEESK